MAKFRVFKGNSASSPTRSSLEAPTTISASPQIVYVDRVVEVVKEVQVPFETIKEVRIEAPPIEVQVPVEKIVIKEVPVETIKEIQVQVLDEATLKRLRKMEIDTAILRSDLSFATDALADLRREGVILRNKPSRIEKLEKDLKRFKQFLLIINMIQIAAGMTYLLMKGL